MTNDTDALAEQLRAARDSLNRALALLGESDAATVQSTPTHTVEPDWRPLKTAARDRGIHPDTMARQARAHGLGRLINRVWRIDMNRVRAWEEGRPYARLMSEDSARCGNSPDASDDTPAAS